MHDGSTSSSPVFDPTQVFTDDNSYYTCMAAYKNSKNSANSGLIGMVHELTQYDKIFKLDDMQAMLQNT